ncbi:hypothetical protein ABZ502_17130 [Streptomyces abikoensis]|uniref:hypothetical protein n=1 Tax=Streptomyces abikoensis TaxID=97398 RepID=UPI0033EFF43A
MIDLGIRIELYAPAASDTGPRHVLGALCRDTGYTALAVPAVGTHLSVSSLRLTTRQHWKPLVLGSSLRVHDVVHTPIPQRHGQVPPWWEEPSPHPSATVVLHATLRCSALVVPHIRQFAADGWSLRDAAEDSALRPHWHRAIHEHHTKGLRQGQPCSSRETGLR